MHFTHTEGGRTLLDVSDWEAHGRCSCVLYVLAYSFYTTERGFLIQHRPYNLSFEYKPMYYRSLTIHLRKPKTLSSLTAEHYNDLRSSVLLSFLPFDPVLEPNKQVKQHIDWFVQKLDQKNPSTLRLIKQGLHNLYRPNRIDHDSN